MSDKLGAVTTRDMVHMLRMLGYEQVRRDGSHMQFAHPDRALIVTVVDRGAKPFSEGTLHAMRRQLGLTRREFADAIRRSR